MDRPMPDSVVRRQRRGNARQGGATWFFEIVELLGLVLLLGTPPLSGGREGSPGQGMKTILDCRGAKCEGTLTFGGGRSADDPHPPGIRGAERPPLGDTADERADVGEPGFAALSALGQR